MDWVTDQPTELQLKLKLETKLARLFSTSALKYDAWHSESFHHLYPIRSTITWESDWQVERHEINVVNTITRRTATPSSPPSPLLSASVVQSSTCCFHAGVWLKRKNLQGRLSALKVEVQEHQITVTINCVIDSSPVTVQETGCWRFFNFTLVFG